MLNDLRQEVAELKKRLNQGEEAARSGNVWLEVIDYNTNESVFVNPFDGRQQDEQPRGFINDLKAMRKAAKDLIKMKVASRKQESRMKDMEVSSLQ